MAKHTFCWAISLQLLGQNLLKAHEALICSKVIIFILDMQIYADKLCKLYKYGVVVGVHERYV